MKISCIVVDDEPLALEKMRSFIAKVPFLELKASFSNGLDTLEYLNNNQVDLMFLDIQMDDLTGIQLLEVLTNKPKVIFTTAYDQFALKGYELDVCDYLLKPISFNRFLQAVNKIYQLKNSHQNTEQTTVQQTDNFTEIDSSIKKNYTFIKTEYRMQKVNFDDILYIEGMKDYLMVRTTQANIMTLMNFKNMEELLPSENFVRTHKSYIVSINKIESIERNRIKIGKELIPVSDTYKDKFYKALKIQN